VSARTTLSISAGQAPAFIYEIRTQQPPTEVSSTNEVLAMVPEVGRAFGMNVGVDWHDGSGSQSARDTITHLARAGGVER